MHHISEEEFRFINCLLTSKMVNQYINTITYNFVINTCPYCLNEIFQFAHIAGYEQGITFLNLRILFAKQTWDKKQFLTLVSLFGTACLTQLTKGIV